MSYQMIKGIPVWGTPQQNAVDQIVNCMLPRNRGYKAALMSDHHLGFVNPVGGVIAYQDAVSPSSVGADVACGNKAVLTDATVLLNLQKSKVILLRYKLLIFC